MDGIERVGPAITAPGYRDGMPAELYHSAGVTPQPALSSSGARMIEQECPALYHYRHLDPAYVREQKRAFDIGTALHLLVLEPELFEGAVSVIEGKKKNGKPSDGYASQDAKDQRDAAYGGGKTPLLPEEIAKLRAMRDAIFRHPVAKLAFVGGVAERSYFWKDEETGIWCKARPDYAPAHLRYFTDVKTSTSANPRAFERRVWDLGYHMQAAWYLDARHAIDGVRPERFAFIVVSTEPPHLVTPVWLDAETVAWGALQNQRARQTFARCLERGEWPAYRDPEKPHVDTAFTVTLPPWAKHELEKQHGAGRFEPQVPSRPMLDEIVP